MNTFYQLGKHEPVVRLVQITDPHLFSDSNETLLGVNTYQSFQAVLTEIQQSNFSFDAVLATGDLVQDYQISAYHRFAQMVEPLNKPVFWLEGNHDTQPQMSLQLGEYAHIHADKQILAGKKWQILLLNSQISNAPSGKLSYGQQVWLQQKLSELPERFTLVALHHNILPTNSAWLDQHSLKNSNELADILNQFDNVKAILHGHIHQEVNAVWNGIQIFATPSTCIQFKPNCDNFTLDFLPPGWREIELWADGRVKTNVKRLNSNEFLPDFGATGY